MAPARLVLATLSRLAVLVIACSPATAATEPAPGLDPWPADTGAHALRSAAPDAGDLGLDYRPRWFDQGLTLALRGRLENQGLQDLQRFGITTAVRSQRFELGTSWYDDVAGAASARGGALDRRLDGYGIALGARVAELPWAWIRAKRQWQTQVNGETAVVSDRLSVQLGPLAPLEVETGTTGEGDRRSWFAQLRFRIELGGG